MRNIDWNLIVCVIAVSAAVVGASAFFSKCAADTTASETECAARIAASCLDENRQECGLTAGMACGTMKTVR